MATSGTKYKKYLKSLKKTTEAVKTDQLVKYTRDRMLGKIDWEKKSKRLKLKDYIKKSPEALKRIRLYKGANPYSIGAKAIMQPNVALSVLKKLAKRTGIGKAVAAATVVAGAYEAGKRKLFTKKDKKKVDKKSIGGETVVMKSGGGYIDDLL